MCRIKSTNKYIYITRFDRFCTTFRVFYIKKGGVIVSREPKKEEHTKEEEGIMAVAKPNTRAFVLSAEKVDQFVKRNNASQKAAERFRAHRPKSGVSTPLKGRNV